MSKDPNQLPAIQLSLEEEQLLKECRIESFWRRSLPIMMMNFATMHYFHTKRPMGNYVVKQVASAFLSYGFGQFLYLSECKKKLFANLPEDSKLLARIKKNDPQLRQYQEPDVSSKESNTVQTESNFTRSKFTDTEPYVAKSVPLVNTDEKTNRDSFKKDKKVNIRDPFEIAEEPNAKIQQSKQAKPNANKETKQNYRTNKYGDIVYSEND
jgi:hypothetical protein